MHPVRGLSSSHSSYPNIVSDVSVRIPSIAGSGPGDQEDVGQGCLGNCPQSGSRLLQLSFSGGKGNEALASHVQPLPPEQVCSANSVQDGDCSLGVTLHPGGGFPVFHRPEGHLFSDTSSSVVKEAIEVSVEGSNLPVQGPVLQTVGCSSGLHQGVYSGLCMGSLMRDSSSQVPGRWLVLASSEAVAKRNVQDLLSLCYSLGVVINEKSDLIPSQTANYLGMTIDTGAAKIFPALVQVEKFLSVAE